MTQEKKPQVDKFVDAISDALLHIHENKNFKHARDRFLNEIWGDIEYQVIMRMDEVIQDFVYRMARNTVEAIMRGDENQMRRYLGLDGYTGRHENHEVIHGTLFETGAIKLRKEIADAHADLIKNERIKDLEEQVKSLVNQINEKDKRLDELFERTK